MRSLQHPMAAPRGQAPNRCGCQASSESEAAVVHIAGEIRHECDQEGESNDCSLGSMAKVIWA